MIIASRSMGATRNSDIIPVSLGVAFSQYPRGKVMGYTMRTKRFRYTEWQDRKTHKVLARELYDHEKDPDENINAADQPEYKDDIKRLAKILKAGYKDAMPEK